MRWTRRLAALAAEGWGTLFVPHRGFSGRPVRPSKAVRVLRTFLAGAGGLWGRMRLAVLLLSLALPAAAQEVRPADQERLGYFDEHLGRALRAALAGGAPEDVAVLTQALAGLPRGDLDPSGDWRCRTLKLGGLTPLTAYADFDCRITPKGPGAWRLEKLTGSQRVAGTITATQGGTYFTGVGHVGDAPAAGYAALDPFDQTPLEPNQTHAVVGLFEQPAPDRARLMEPAPILESAFDVLYLTR